MTIRTIFLACLLTALAVCAACSKANPVANNQKAAAKPAATPPNVPAALPDAAFKAEITFVNPPAKLRAGEKVVVQVKIKNASTLQWWARGAQFNTSTDSKFIVAAADRWLKADGSLLTNMDGRYGITKDLKPGEEDEVPLTVTAPTTPGDYILEVDVVQEAVTWFSDKGSPTAKTKITVAK
jgi:glucose/arabinose dehydrogenase